jgi:fatty-acyl-CoA synthase
LSENSISKQLYLSACQFPDELAFVSDFQNVSLTYSELFETSKRVAANLLDLGVKPGSKLGIFSPNNIEWALCQYATCLADIIMVNINPAYKPYELQYGINLVGLETLVVSDNKLPSRILDNVEYFVNQQDKTQLRYHSSSGNTNWQI